MITRFSIGEFSKVTGIPPKTLRFYHEKGILIPAAIDQQTGYRFYDQRCFERAQVITALKSLDFSLEDIGRILAEGQEDEDILDYLESQKRRIAQEIKRHHNIVTTIDRIIEVERENRKILADSTHTVEEKTLEGLMVAGIRVTGRYRDCGPTFGTLGRKLGRHISGKAMCLYYDGEYREEDANFEPCFPISRKIPLDGVEVHELPACRGLSLHHLGPYEELGRSYAKLIEYAHEKSYDFGLPSREIYLKGPGMIFKGRPKKYVTEIQIPIS